MTDVLVSVIITSYNSSRYIVETLDSIYRQSWQEIELIITDDCSQDDTVKISTKWLEENGHRFFKTSILTFPQNTGVSANANRGLKAAEGDWIKYLGADDTLKPGCIENNMSFIKANPEIRVLFSQIEIYRDSLDRANLIKRIPDTPISSDDIMSSNRNANSQYRMLLTCDRINYTPSVFLQRDTLISIGGFDERFKMLEDYPLWLNFTKHGHRLFFMEQVTVNYRQHSGAINNTGLDYLINPNYFKSEDFRKECTYPYLPWDLRLNQRYNWIASQLFRWNMLNRRKKCNFFLYNLLTVYLNPFRYLVWIKRRIREKAQDNDFYM